MKHSYSMWDRLKNHPLDYHVEFYINENSIVKRELFCQAGSEEGSKIFQEWFVIQEDKKRFVKSRDKDEFKMRFLRR